jgi:diacylglycerol kinase
MARSWRDKFRSAFAGLCLAIRTERSFAVHLPMAAAVTVCAALLRVSPVETCILILCVSLVLSAEILNTAIEYLARETSREQRPGIAAALDMSSAAVLVASLGAAAVGTIIFLPKLGRLLGWWA